MTPRLAVLTVVSLTAIVAPAGASCIPSTENEQLTRADAAFVGRVLSVRSSDGSAAFRILSVRKGRLLRGAITRVYPVPYHSSVTIGWTPRTGQRWRLYLQRQNRRWITNDCDGTRRL